MDRGDTTRSLSLLVVDDDKELCAMMREFFFGAGHRVESAHDGQAGLAAAIKGSFDLVVLDVMLPKLDGYGVLKELRGRSSLPVIMLTSRTQRRDRILGLDTGADDYLSKPFDPDELLARIRAVLRRTAGEEKAATTRLVVGEIEIDTGTRQVWARGAAVDLTAIEFDLLALLMRRVGKIVTREEISLSVLKREAEPYDRVLDVHVSRIRKKLESGRNLIRTIRGAGYVFTGID
jgi:two-component system response regulator CpxR